MLHRLPAQALVSVLLGIGVSTLAGCCAPRAVQRPAEYGIASDHLAPWTNENLIFPERLEQGYTLLLCGAMGLSRNDNGIPAGLQRADVPSALELYDWTGTPYNLVANMRNGDHNRAAARVAAEKIVCYQRRYPGRPVYLVGYSGGGGVAVLTLEALPPGHAITRAVLIAPTVSADYDLRPALRSTRLGIHNFYSTLDVPILMILGTAVGTTEGRHALAGGAMGFVPPAGLTAQEREEYRSRITQSPYDLDMIWSGNYGGHFGWTAQPFVAEYVGPLLSETADEPARVARRER